MQIRWILNLSILSLLFLSIGSFLVWQKWDRERLKDEKYVIKKLSHTSSSHERLPPSFLVKVLNLKSEKNLNFFDVDSGEKALKAYPFIKKVEIKKLMPDTLYIDYLLRKPIAFVEDWDFIAVDQEGILFNIDRFYSPKKLPILYLGLNHAPLNIKKDKFQLADNELTILVFFLRHLKNIKRLDLSRLRAPNLIDQEVLLTLKEPMEHTLIFKPENLDKTLNHYLSLKEKELITGKVINMRVPNIALVKESK